MLSTYEITPDIAEEFTAGVPWLQTNGRPDLTVPLALREAVEDWISALPPNTSAATRSLAARRNRPCIFSRGCREWSAAPTPG